MYDWVSTVPRYYEKYSYEIKSSPSKSLSSLPPTQPRRSIVSGTSRLSQSVLQRKQTLQSISRLIGQEDYKIKAHPVPMKRTSVVYQTQPLIYASVENFKDQNSYKVQTEYYVPVDQTFSTIPQEEDVSIYENVPYETKQDNLVYYVANPDDYGNNNYSKKNTLTYRTKQKNYTFFSFLFFLPWLIYKI